MILINVVAIAASIFTGVLLIFYLVRVVGLMRRIATSLATVRLLLRTVANQTEGVPDFVAGIQVNVESLGDAVDQLGTGVGAGSKAAT
jgi:hypothetical protein